MHGHLNVKKNTTITVAQRMFKLFYFLWVDESKLSD